MALVKYNNNSLSAITSTGLTAGAMTLIKSQTASSSANVTFVHGTSDVVLDSTYPIYVFKFINIHPSNNDVVFQTNFRDGSTDYDATKTTTNFEATHTESGTSGFKYGTGDDIAQGTGTQRTGLVGSDNDESLVGELWLFSPSSTTYVKHFLGMLSCTEQNPAADQAYIGGYFNTTTALDTIIFKFSSGNIDSGTFKLYGIKDS